mmetsp:Transcript_15766/g.46512  ORF Transcript_15766/g.46512 Transcript_15766/m.46512 type:complete len:207 (-) Transcript_15766:97-717(-)
MQEILRGREFARLDVAPRNGRWRSERAPHGLRRRRVREDVAAVRLGDEALAGGVALVGVARRAAVDVGAVGVEEVRALDAQRAGLEARAVARVLVAGPRADVAPPEGLARPRREGHDVLCHVPRVEVWPEVGVGHERAALPVAPDLGDDRRRHRAARRPLDAARARREAVGDVAEADAPRGRRDERRVRRVLALRQESAVDEDAVP